MDAPPTSHASPVPAPTTTFGTTYTGPRPTNPTPVSEGTPPPAPYPAGGFGAGQPPARSGGRNRAAILATGVAVVAIIALVAVLIANSGNSDGQSGADSEHSGQALDDGLPPGGLLSPARSTPTPLETSTASATPTPEPDRTIDPAQAAVVRHEGKATLRSENYIDLDSKADNWDQDSTAGAASPDLELSYSGRRIESYSSGSRKSIVLVQPGSPATFATCNAATGYTGSLESADIQDRKPFCVKTDGSRYSYVTIAAADADPNGGFSRVVLNIKTFDLQVRPTPTS
jgi:hypothetical protein